MSEHLRHCSPQFSIAQAKEIAKKYYHLTDFIEQLPSERDQNFLFQTTQSKFILKIANIDELSSVLDMQNCAMEYIHTNIRILPSVDGQKIVTHENHLIRLVNYLPGIPLAHYRPHNSTLLINLGRMLAQIDQSLQGFTHESIERDLYWNMINAEHILQTYQHLILHTNDRQIIEDILHHWIERIHPQLTSLRISVIHNDANDYNLIVNNDQTIDLIDFGDMCQTYLLCEVAIACAYVMLDKDSPLQAASHVIDGYHQIYPLEDREIDCLFYFIRMRLAMSVTISAHQKQMQPENHYLLISEIPAWNLLRKLMNMEIKVVQDTFRSVCYSKNN